MSRYFWEMARLAGRHGVMAEEKEEGLNMTMDGAYLCRVLEKGSVLYRRIDADTYARRKALDEIINDASIALEYVSAMETAPFLKAAGLDKKFKLLLSYGGYLLAGHDRGTHGFEFVTWEWNWDHTAVGTGDYYEDDYRGAKEDFASRSGLVNPHRLFDKVLTMDLYRLVCRQLESVPDSFEEQKRLEEIKWKMDHSFPDFEGRAQLERLAADPRTGYIILDGKRRTPYATGWMDEESGTYLSHAQPDKFPQAKQFESPLDGLAKLCQEKIHLRDYEQPWDYPIILQRLPDACALASRLNYEYEANSGFLVDGLAFVKAASEADEWLLCKQADGVWQALDHVSLYNILKYHGEDYFGRWMEALQNCPASGYPEQMHLSDVSAPEQEGPTL